MRRLVFCAFVSTPSMKGMLLIFLSPTNLVSVSWTFNGVGLGALEAAGAAPAGCGLSCAASGIHPIASIASAATIVLLTQHTPLSESGSTPIPTGHVSGLDVRYRNRLDRQRRNHKVGSRGTPEFLRVTEHRSADL